MKILAKLKQTASLIIEWYPLIVVGIVLAALAIYAGLA